MTLLQTKKTVSKSAIMSGMKFHCCPFVTWIISADPRKNNQRDSLFIK